MVRFRLAVLALLTTLAALVLPAAPAQAALSVAGGDVLTNSIGARCQLGFNLSGRGILAAASCGPVGTQWYSGTDLIGTTVVQGATASLIFITNTAVVQLHGIRVGGGAVAPVTSAARATVGQTVSFYSSTGGLRTGTVTGVNQTLNYSGGTISGLDRTTLCASSRDPGSPVVSGPVGLSIIFGGSTTCRGGAVFAQPITPLLAGWGRTIF